MSLKLALKRTMNKGAMERREEGEGEGGGEERNEIELSDHVPEFQFLIKI